MPLPEGVTPDPDRPFITVRTATRFHDPEEIRRYETRGDCLADLDRWQDSSLVRQDAYYHLGVGYEGDEDTYTFEVYENGELRLQLDIDRLGQRHAGTWARPADQAAARPALELDDYIARYARDENHDAASWTIAQDKSTPAGRLLADLSNPQKIAPTSSRAIMRTFEADCERAEAACENGQTLNFERILRRAIERQRQTMQDTPERTWDKIKAGYAAVYEAAGANVNKVPYQDAYPALHELVRNAADTAHYPDHHEARFRALLNTLDTCAERKTAINDLHVDIARTVEGLDRLIRYPGTIHNPRIERNPHFPDWANDRATVIANWTETQADIDLKQHLPHFDYEAMKDGIDRIADPAIPTLFHPEMASSRTAIYDASPMQRIIVLYARALEFVDHDPNLLPYSPRLEELQFGLERTIQECTDNPDQLLALNTLNCQIAVSIERQSMAITAAEDLTEATEDLSGLINWSQAFNRPVHEYPEFDAWRDRADRVTSRCEAILQDPRLTPHFQRAGASEETARTTIAYLRQDRYRKPPSPEEIAARRQTRAEARADSREESFSMSA